MANQNLNYRERLFKAIKETDITYKQDQKRSKEELNVLYENRKAKRKDTRAKHFHRILVLGLYIFAILYFIALFVIFYHMIVPINWHWLDVESLNLLKNTLVAFTIGFGGKELIQSMRNEL